jgi:hypothetical protein
MLAIAASGEGRGLKATPKQPIERATLRPRLFGGALSCAGMSIYCVSLMFCPLHLDRSLKEWLGEAGHM